MSEGKDGMSRGRHYYMSSPIYESWVEGVPTRDALTVPPRSCFPRGVLPPKRMYLELEGGWKRVRRGKRFLWGGHGPSQSMGWVSEVTDVCVDGGRDLSLRVLPSRFYQNQW